jgi:hypothetical protein
MAGSSDDLHYPVFWANDPSLNFLNPPDELHQLLASASFQDIQWLDLTQASAEWFRAMLESRNAKGNPPLGFQVFITDSPQQKAANVLRNLEEKRISVIQAAFKLRKR